MFLTLLLPCFACFAPDMPCVANKKITNEQKATCSLAPWFARVHMTNEQLDFEAVIFYDTLHAHVVHRRGSSVHETREEGSQIFQLFLSVG